jgi:hypothetical protein
LKALGKILATVGVFLGIFGAVATWGGWSERKLGANSTPAPISVDLAKLETGERPGNNHLKIGRHYAYYRDMVYSYQQTKGVPETASTPVNHAYYAIISPEHPDAKELDEVIKEHGKLKDVPDEKLPKMNHFVMLVKTKRFKTEGDVEKQPSVVVLDGVQGLVINEVEPLKDDEKELIHQRYPSLDFNKVLILEENRKPMDPGLALTILLAGIGMLFFGILGFVGGIALSVRAG